MSEKYDVYYEKPKEDYESYSDSSFIAGDSPATLDVFGDLERITYNGQINCDGAGDLLIGLSSDGTTYNDNITLKSGEILDLRTFNLKKIKITHSGTDSSYRVVVY